VGVPGLQASDSSVVINVINLSLNDKLLRPSEAGLRARKPALPGLVMMMTMIDRVEFGRLFEGSTIA
jgi:hypothetical protein